MYSSACKLYCSFVEWNRASLYLFINPWQACAARVTVVVLCVYVCGCLSVTRLAATYLVCRSESKVSLGFLW